MRHLVSVLFLLFSIVSEPFAQSNHDNSAITPPLKPPFFFAGDFGELRSSHFHSGLDFRTQGRTGIAVFAVKDGYISRIGISPTGYGNVLYMNHGDGTTSVYGHLERFHPKIELYLRNEQYDRETFQINLTPLSGKFQFKRGDIIAWSGNTGSSGGPHLHFEIRDTHSEQALNPIFYKFGITDNSPPKIIALYVYPQNEKTTIGHDRTKKRFEAIAVPGGYRLKNNTPLEINGEVGFGIQAEDFFNGTGLKCGIYSAILYVDKKEMFGFKMDKVSFDDARYANAQGDFEEHILANRWVERLFKFPGNYLAIYHPENSTGLLTIETNQKHECEIIVTDAFTNKTSLKFTTAHKKYPLTETKRSFTQEFYFDQSNIFENENIRINMPKGALYENIKFTWSSGIVPTGCYTDLQQVHSMYTPVHIPYSLSIKCLQIPESLLAKSCIVLVDPIKGKKSSIGGDYSNGWITAKTNLFGSFSVAVDQTAPLITPLSIKEGKNLTDTKKIQFRITDNLSGIKSYRGEIDGKWVLFEYDEKSAIITYTFDKQRMTFGKSHLLRLVVIDNRDNSSEYKAILYK